MNNLSSLVDWAVNLSRKIKVAGQILLDLSACAFSAVLVLKLVPGMYPSFAWNFIGVSLVSCGLFVLPAFAFGIYRMVVRFIGWRGALRIGFAIAIYGAGLLVVHVARPINLTLGYVAIQPPIFFILILGWRSIVRYVFNQKDARIGAKAYNSLKSLIYGAGSAGRQLANGLIIDGEIQVVGFVDDDAELHGCNINGLKIYSPDQILRLVQSEIVTDIYLAIPSLSRIARRAILERLKEFPVAVRSLPTLSEIANGRVHVSDLRCVPIEEVLGRPCVSPDLELLGRNINGKAVLVSGAGGSIGSEIARQAFKNNPSALVLVEQNEYALYEIERELQGRIANKLGTPKVIGILGSVSDSKRMSIVCKKFCIQTIYHAAAYKHVPLVEQNPLMGIQNNIFGTLSILDVAEQSNVETFVLISTDKAVRPTNIMGCTKRVAELILQARHQTGLAKNIRTKFTMVRFGNVLGSSGSVIPAFQSQIQSGGPVTVTHPDVTRYFMTIPEAAQLVIQAGALGKGGDVMVLDMGEPIKIIKLAENMIHLSGLRVKSERDLDGDIEIVYTGLRPGEKLYEELLLGDNTSPTRHPKISCAREESVTWEFLKQGLNDLRVAVSSGNSEFARKTLSKLVPEFVPQCANQDWLH